MNQRNWRSSNMPKSIEVGTVIASCFTILEVKKNKSVPPAMSNYVSEVLSIELDAKYENHSRLSVYKVNGPIPAAGQWPFLVPDNYVDIQMKKRSWIPTRVKPPCGAMAYTARTPEGNRVAIVHMMAATERAMVLAMVSWAGMPGLNRFSVGFKPGMEMHTEDLLLAGLELCNTNSV
jgi:hypothetical protein